MAMAMYMVLIKYYVYGYVYGASDKNGDMDYHLVICYIAMEDP
jgi:hypothetical protein